MTLSRLTLRPLAVVMLAGTVLAGTVPLAHAAFVNQAAASATLSTDRLLAPTGMSVAKRCTSILLSLTDQRVDLTWTRSPTAWATGQSVVVTSSLGWTSSTVTVGPGVMSTNVNVPESLSVLGVSYTATVRATFGGSWTSTVSTGSDSTCG